MDKLQWLEKLNTSSNFDEGLSIAQDWVYEVNHAKGWFDGSRSVGDEIALLHSELSEMLEAYRTYGMMDATARDSNGIPKPEGVGSEVADVLIRLFDFCERHGIDLGYEFIRKMLYNETREYRHGGKKL